MFLPANQEPTAYRLRGDRDRENPTVWWIVVAESLRTEMYVGRYTAEVNKRDVPVDVRTRNLNALDREFVQDSVLRVECAPPDGRTVEDPAEIAALIKSLAFAQKQELLSACQDSERLQEGLKNS